MTPAVVTRAATGFGFAVFFAVLLLGLVLGSARAWAELKVPEATPGMLSIWTDSLPVHYSEMGPGDEAYVRLTLQLDDAPVGDLALQVRKSGALATVDGGLVIDVARCAVPWTGVPTGVTESADPECASGAEQLLAADSGDDFRIVSPTWDLDQIHSVSLVYMLVTLSLPESTALSRVEGLSADFGFGLFATSPAGALTPAPARLVVTGTDALPLILIGVGALGIGTIAVARRGRTRAER